MPTANVVDVSEWQPTSIDWANLKANGVQAVVVRIGHGTTQDTNAAEHISNASKAGLIVHVYHYYEGVDGELEYSVSNAKSLSILPNVYYFLDMEGTIAGSWPNIFKSFRQQWASYGWNTGLYCSLSNYAKFDDATLVNQGVYRWIAAWGNDQPSNADMWQYDSKTGLGSYTSALDKDVDVAGKLIKQPDNTIVKPTDPNGNYPIKPGAFVGFDYSTTELAGGKMLVASPDGVNKIPKLGPDGSFFFNQKDAQSMRGMLIDGNPALVTRDDLDEVKSTVDAPIDLGNYNVDGITNAGIYKSYGNLQGLPGQPYGILEVLKNDTDVLQRFTQTNTDTPLTWQRIKNNNIEGWSNWISVTTAATLASWEVNNDQSIVDLNTDKAIYSPYERVEFEGYMSSNSGKIKVEYYRREILMNTQTIPFMAGIVNWSWYLPGDDQEQYYAKITVVTNSGEGNPQYVAINVDSSGKHIPIMGFLSSYGEYNPNNEKNVINDLKRHHINYLQYYDCYERPEHLIRTNLTGEDNQAGMAVDYWKDISRHQVRADVLREYITLGKRSGIKNMLYMPWGNTSVVAGNDGILPQMLLYNDKSKAGNNSAVPATLEGGDGQWARYSLMQANPSNPDFKNMLFGSAQEALEVMGFDGLHIDTLGPIYDNTYDDSGSQYSNDFAASSGMPYFINDAANYFNKDSWQKTGSNIRMSFNNVGSWGIESLAGNGNLDFLYAEQWPSMGNKTYDDMIKKIIYINSKSNWQRVVIPAYMHKDATASSSTFNTNGVILTNLIIMASGATHIELGEHMLCSEYFPNNSLSMNDDLKEWEVQYYDFLVAYARMFNMKNYTSNTFCASHKLLHNDFSRDFEITAIEQEDEYLSAVSLINIKDINGDEWRDSNFDRNEPTKLTNVGLGWPFKPKGVYYCTIEDPQPKKLVPDNNNYVFIPELDRYALIYAYK